MSTMTIENLSMRFDLPNGGHVQALQDMTLELKTGEMMSVLGPSGCGEATLLNILAAFLTPTDGTIMLNGHRVTGPDAERGMVFQQGALFRVIIGLVLGAAAGIPQGYAMGLSNWFRGWFDPIVEFMRPVPPLALIPLVIIWAGIGETGKIILLFLAVLWVMAIAARAGVSGVAISKVHAAYSLGASKWQLMRYDIVPNSLPEIFTGARVAMGVCWGTVVAAELVPWKGRV